MVIRMAVNLLVATNFPARHLTSLPSMKASNTMESLNPTMMRFQGSDEISSGTRRDMKQSLTMRHLHVREPGFPPIPRPQPEPEPDPEPQPGSDPDVVPPIRPEPEPARPQPTPEPEPMPI